MIVKSTPLVIVSPIRKSSEEASSVSESKTREYIVPRQKQACHTEVFLRDKMYCMPHQGISQYPDKECGICQNNCNNGNGSPVKSYQIKHSTGCGKNGQGNNEKRVNRSEPMLQGQRIQPSLQRPAILCRMERYAVNDTTRISRITTIILFTISGSVLKKVKPESHIKEKCLSIHPKHERKMTVSFL